MRIDRRRSALTLIEMLIVVVIIAVLATTIIPQLVGPRLSPATKGAKEASLQYNLGTLRVQIGLYKDHHSGAYPTIDAATESLPQLTNATNVNGETGPPGPDHPYGPYVGEELPANPYDGKTRVVAVANPRLKPAGPADLNGGWQYDVTTGAIWPNNSDFDFSSL